MKDTKFAPVKRQFKRQYLNIDLKELKNGVQAFLNNRSSYFSKPLDSVNWSLSSKDGKQTGEGKIENTLAIFEMLSEKVEQMEFTLFVENVTKHLKLLLPPEEYVTLSINFINKTFFFEISIASEVYANRIFRMFTIGINFMDTHLPEERRFLEPHLTNLSKDHPLFEKNILLIMRFNNEPKLSKITDIIRSTCKIYELDVLRVDDKIYADDLWDNVMTYMYACKYAVAVFEQINYREFNPNIALEVGFMLAQRKRVLILKDIAIPVLPADIIGKIYHPFDTHDIESSIEPQIKKWLKDCEII